MSNLMRWPVLVNAVLFQITWFACVLGSAKDLVWPALVSCAALAIWQLQPKRRHPSDIKLIMIAIVLGLIVDTLWIQLNLLDFTQESPLSAIAPAWIILLWIGFALTINHSLSWLNAHPILPIAMGLIGGPLSYYAGLRLGAVDYLADTALISAALGVAWAISLYIMVKASTNPETSQA